MRDAITLIALLALTGCKESLPVMPTMPEIVEVEVVKFVEVPPELTAPCQDFTAREQTYAEAKRLALLRKEARDECDGRMTKIRNLPVSPSVKP
jgi:hypothetical protein